MFCALHAEVIISLATVCHRALCKNLCWSHTKVNPFQWMMFMQWSYSTSFFQWWAYLCLCFWVQLKVLNLLSKSLFVFITWLFFSFVLQPTLELTRLIELKICVFLHVSYQWCDLGTWCYILIHSSMPLVKCRWRLLTFKTSSTACLFAQAVPEENGSTGRCRVYFFFMGCGGL